MISELLQQGGLSFERLRTFCLVAESGGVTKAAKGDAVKQSLYSRQIRELEEFFGTELIRRKGRGIALTEAGARLRNIVLENFAALSDFKNEWKGKPFEVVIGTGDSVIQWLLLPKLEEIRKRVPLVRFKFLNLSTDDAVKRLNDGLIDFAVIREDAVSRPLKALPLGVMGYSLFVPRELNVQAAPKDKIRFLDNLPLATLEGEGRFRAALTETAKRKHITMNIQIECSSFPLAARAAAYGHVAAVLPAIAAKELALMGAAEISLPFLREFDRKMCLASKPRSIRIRPALTAVGNTIAQFCRF